MDLSDQLITTSIMKKRFIGLIQVKKSEPCFKTVQVFLYRRHHPAGIYLFKFISKSSRLMH